MIGETVKGFKITQRLGKGAFGEVWEAEQQIVRTRVAIKLLHAERSTDRQHVERFFREAVAAGKIRHAGAVKISDVGYHAGRAFLIMEFLEGETLASRIARVRRLQVGDVAEIGRQIASVLGATHAAGIVHRDLKPENVFLVPDAELASGERVKVLDFGLAKLGIGSTTSGMTMGTPAYMAPEQWEHASRVDGRADVYSLGCIVFQMCCGHVPFDAETFSQWYATHRDAPPPRASSLVPELPAELDDLIAGMLAKSPADRPAVRDLGAAFARLAAAHGTTVDGTNPPVPPPGPSPSPDDPGERTWLGRLLVTAAGVVGGIAMIVGGTRLIATCNSPPQQPDAMRAQPDAMRAQPDALRAQPDASSAPPDAALEPPKPEVIANRWVRIDPPSARYLLGMRDNAPDAYEGFRASRRIFTPSEPYEIQEHEVTWSEIEPWLVRTGTQVDYPPWAAEAGTRARLPATNLTWSIARDYCQSFGGHLPTEEQWEYAARGPEGRPNPWGAAPLDLQMTHAYAGPTARPSPVMENQQDQTPGPGGPIWDLAGNVQEWTLELWREPRAGMDESDVQRGETTSRAIRGLPLAKPPPATLQPDSAAFRKRLCTTGPCVKKTREFLPYVGLRCTRSLAK